MSDGKKKILIVEDDKSLREMYQLRLSINGYDVIEGKDGEEGLDLAIKEKPDLIMLDIMMPKMSGMDVLDIIKSTPETKDIPVILLTALNEDSVRSKGLVYGAEDYLVKSQTMPGKVVEKIEEVLARKEGKA
ncbi:response regulator [bacterium]|nr:response regulator [bacterium]